jgi:hypothetical protein
MFEELKRKYAHYIIKKKYLRLGAASIEFKKIISNSQSVLAIMPDTDADFEYSMKVLEFLNAKSKEVTLFVSELRHKKIPENRAYQLMSFHPEQITRFFLPTKNLIRRISDKKFDLVIDLNRHEDTFFSCITNVVESKVRIGFRKNRSDEYYNLLYESKQTEPEAAYLKFLEHINMF